MARSLVLANGELHVGLNNFGEVSDLYFPYVGLENHLADHNLRHRLGVWVDGNLSWLDGEDWVIISKYHESTMVGHTDANNHRLGIRLEFDDCVDSSQAALLRNIHVINHHDQKRDIRLFIHQAFDISNSRAADTAVYLPKENALLHYKGKRAFVVNARHANGTSFDDFSVGLQGLDGHRDTYKDVGDGTLQQKTVAHGRADSVLGLHCSIAPHSSTRVHYWLTAGKSINEALKINQRIVAKGLPEQMSQTEKYWRQWLKPATKTSHLLGKQYGKALIDSLLIIKAHTDKRGAVMASLDSTLRDKSRDSYAFCWPRQAAYSLWPLLRLGFNDELIQFFGFCKQVMDEKGYLATKYHVDGAIGSTWHPYMQNKFVEMPIESDSTASVLFLFGQYYRQQQDKKVLKDFYESMVQPMANFLSRFVGENHLPMPSYDIWGEDHLTTTYTTAVTYASLLEASELADAYGANDDSVRWRTVADDMKKAALKTLYNPSKQYFYRGVMTVGDKTTRDETIDASSLYGVFMYGLYELDSPELTQAYKTANTTLRNKTQPAAISRYKGDSYHRLSENDESNPWPVTSLWFAQYALEQDDHVSAKRTLDWLMSLMHGGSCLPEMVDPHHFEHISVSPFAWSHGELASTLLDTLNSTKGGS